jgi:predicted dehydrogenase
VAVPAELQLADVPPPKEVGAGHRFTHLELGPYTRLCQQFATAINGGGTGMAATFADGVAVQRILDAVRDA